MLLTYVGRELRGRRRQTIIVAAGLALAVALVLAVSAASTGVRNAQSGVLDAVYGVGTDITVTQQSQPGAGPGGGGNFQFDAQDGTTDDDGTTVSSDRLELDRGSTAISADTVTQVAAADGVADVTATLVLRDTTFNGQLPEATSESTPSTTGPPDGQGGGGFGGGNFDVDSFAVEGITPGASALGPLSGASVTSGRGFATDDAGQDVALVSSTYASSESLAVGDTVTVTGTPITIVGILSASSATTALSDVYLPLDVAQALAGLDGQVTNLYVQATGADSVDAAAAAIAELLPDATVSTQADLASSVTGSLASASSLVRKLGTWLAVAVLVAAFVLAVLFTISGVTRRTRDFGTLKAIGWSNGRIVRQVGTESLVQGLLGGVVGLVVGLIGIAVINAIGIDLSGTTGEAATAAAPSGAPAGGAPEGAGAFGGRAGQGLANAAESTVDVVLHAPVEVTVVLLGLGLAVLGGLLAGVIGGWRAARLQPAAALRSLD